MFRYFFLRSVNDPNRLARVRTDFHAQTTTNAAIAYIWSILVPHFETDGFVTKRTYADARATDPPVDPWVASRTVDLGNTHVDFLDGCRHQCIRGAYVDAFAAENAAFLSRIDIRCVDHRAAVAAMKPDAAWRADLST